MQVDMACLQGVLPYELIPWPIGLRSPSLLRDASSSHRREIHQLKGFVVPGGTKAPEGERHGGFRGRPQATRSIGASTSFRIRSITCKRRSWFDGVIGSNIAEVAYPVSAGQPPVDHGAEERLDKL